MNQPPEERIPGERALSDSAPWQTLEAALDLTPVLSP
jgi:hypothetical protein